MSQEGFSIQMKKEDFDVKDFRENCGVFIGVLESDNIKIVRTHRVDRNKKLLIRRNGYIVCGGYVGYMYDVWEVKRSSSGWVTACGKSIKKFSVEMLAVGISQDIKNIERLIQNGV